MAERWTPAYQQPPPPPPRPPPRVAYQPLTPFVPWLIAAAAFYFLMSVLTNVLSYTSTGAVLLVSLLVFPVSIGALVALLLWSHRAASNADAFGAKGRTLGTVWAIVGWIIPLAHLVLPYLAFRDIWKASDPNLPAEAWDAAPVPGWFHGWWLAWAGAGIVAFVVSGIQTVRNIRDTIGRDAPPANPFTQPTTAPDLMPLTAVFLGLYTIAFILFVRLVRELDKRQAAKARALFGTAAPMP